MSVWLIIMVKEWRRLVNLLASEVNTIYFKLVKGFIFMNDSIFSTLCTSRMKNFLGIEMYRRDVYCFMNQKNNFRPLAYDSSFIVNPQIYVSKVCNDGFLFSIYAP